MLYSACIGDLLENLTRVKRFFVKCQKRRFILMVLHGMPILPLCLKKDLSALKYSSMAGFSVIVHRGLKIQRPYLFTRRRIFPSHAFTAATLCTIGLCCCQPRHTNPTRRHGTSYPNDHVLFSPSPVNLLMPSNITWNSSLAPPLPWD